MPLWPMLGLENAGLRRVDRVQSGFFCLSFMWLSCGWAGIHDERKQTTKKMWARKPCCVAEEGIQEAGNQVEQELKGWY